MQQVDQANFGTRKHACRQISGIVQTKSEPKCGNPENALVAQYTRDASTSAQQVYTELVDRGRGVPSFDEMMDSALVEVDFDDPTTNMR